MHLRRLRDTGEVAEKEKYLSALNQAQIEYDVARSCFGEAIEPDIIDEAIYLMEAARKKYSYFLKKVRDSYSSRPPPPGQKDHRITGQPG